MHRDRSAGSLRLGFGEYADPDGLAPLGVARERFVAAVVAVAPGVILDFERGPLQLGRRLLVAPLRGRVESLDAVEAWRGVEPSEGVAALQAAVAGWARRHRLQADWVERAALTA